MNVLGHDVTVWVEYRFGAFSSRSQRTWERNRLWVYDSYGMLLAIV